MDFFFYAVLDLIIVCFCVYIPWKKEEWNKEQLVIPFSDDGNDFSSQPNMDKASFKMHSLGRLLRNDTYHVRIVLV